MVKTLGSFGLRKEGREVKEESKRKKDINLTDLGYIIKLGGGKRRGMEAYL